ncbi:MAG TPA: alpha/beta hydrolase [Candidatus Avipropionibacterium avicola]|uniref:Alpha/beta hydrolase n=1 Tax=Candidatus Avipropionibacterium avicola TaxID=2840701 RepID=A0A9D1GZL6_9ACTN|nr:alpha/beta hydrolase [Candidatus Avipropionibacterium avicola]
MSRPRRLSHELLPVPGGRVGLWTKGSGPDVVVVHGSGLAARDYRLLLQALCQDFTVHLYDRRGRGGSSDNGISYSVRTEVSDLAAVMAATGSRRVFGHAYGGFVALQAAREHDWDRVVTYDAAVSIDRDTPDWWVGDFEEAVAAGDHGRAAALLVKGLDLVPVVSRIPLSLGTPIGRIYAASPFGKDWNSRAGATLAEVGEVLSHDGPATDYAGITARTTLCVGGASAPWFRRSAEAILPVLPDGRMVAVLSGLGHDAAQRAPKRLVRELVDALT